MTSLFDGCRWCYIYNSKTISTTIYYFTTAEYNYPTLISYNNSLYVHQPVTRYDLFVFLPGKLLFIQYKTKVSCLGNFSFLL